MARVLVTGGAGFIGSHLIDRLLTEDHQVQVIDNLNDYYDPIVKQQNIDRHSHNQNFQFSKVDILDWNTCRSIFKEFQPTLLIHLAARVGVRPSLDQARLYEEVNIRGSLNMLELCREYDCREVILASSSSVYGDDTPVPFQEEARCDRPRSPYAASKRAMELLAYTAHTLWELDSVCLRFFNVYGERGRPDNIPAMFTKLALAGLPVPRFGDGTTQRDYTYVGDIVDGILRARGKQFGFEIINLGNHTPVSLNNFIQTLSEVLGRPIKIDEQPAHPADVPMTYADISKAKRLLDWEPRVNLAEGLRRVVTSLQSFSAIKSNLEIIPALSKQV